MGGDWKTRLREAIAADGRSMRAISLKSDLGANYITEIFTKDKEPGVEKLRRVCAELGVSLSFILTGVDLDEENEAFLALLTGLDDSDRATLLGLARKLQKPNQP
jgi:transcriptional regulator with XRE-family HTH domain